MAQGADGVCRTDNLTADQLQEERRRTREDERKRLQHHHSVQIDRSKLKEVLKAGPGAVHAESQQAAAHDPSPSLSRSYAVNSSHAAAALVRLALPRWIPH